MKTSFLKVFFFLTLLTSYHPLVQAQSYFEKHLENHPVGKVGRIISLPGGGFAAAYDSYSGQKSYAVVAAFNRCGQLLWSEKVFEDDQYVEMLGFQIHQNQLWIGAVLGERFPDSALAVASFDLMGQITQQFSLASQSDYIWYKFHVSTQGQLLFTGNRVSTNELSNTVLRLSSSGQVLNHRQYSQNHIWGMSTPTGDNGVLNISGNMVYRLNDQGNIIWLKRFSNAWQSDIPPIAAADGYYLFCRKDYGHSHHKVLKISMQGHIMWQTPVFELAISAATLDKNNQLYLSGNYSKNGQMGLHVLHINNAGQLVESRKLTAQSGDQRNKAIAAQDDGLLILSAQDGSGGKAALVQRVPKKLPSPYPCSGEAFKPDSSNLSIAALHQPTVNYQDYNRFSSQPASFSISPASYTLQSFCNQKSPRDISLGPDTSLCPGEVIRITPDSLPKGEYKWSNGSQNPSLLVKKPGTYWLEINTLCSEYRWQDTIRIQYFSAPPLKMEYTPERPTYGQRISFKNSDNKEVGWAFSHGDTLFGNQVSYTIEKPGPITIWQFTTTNNGCLIKDSIKLHIPAPELHLPDAFTPNGDGLNDEFAIEAGKIHWYQMEVYDRFGKRLSHSVNSGWDGRIGDIPARPGVYAVHDKLPGV
ncbi:MAG: gliding motility-associated C-terminal domain-containing protein [Owenweeksia sp.]|nr:gliding motility-associated C-terminal domain-containing protein [Owenweeksia sp.]